MPNTDTWGPEHKGAFKSAIMGRQWAQQRLHSTGLVQGSLCRLCMGMPDGGQVGTLLHRMRCPALRTFNQQHMPDCVKELMERTGGEVSSRSLGCLTRALFPCPCPPIRDDGLFDTLHWYAQPSQDAAKASVCTDGSLLHGKWGKIVAAVGWAFETFPAGRCCGGSAWCSTTVGGHHSGGGAVGWARPRRRALRARDRRPAGGGELAARARARAVVSRHRSLLFFLATAGSGGGWAVAGQG